MSAATPENDLRGFLSHTFVAYMKTYALHWNYEGDKFYGIHQLTEKQYRDMAEAIDELAERMRAMGNTAPVSLQQILDHSSLKEYKGGVHSDKAIGELAQTHRNLSTMAKEVAEAAEKNNDPVTHDLLIHRSGVHDKFAWMLESFQ